MIYPELKDADFSQRLLSHKKYQQLTMPNLSPIANEVAFEEKAKNYCEGYEKFLYQYIAQQHLSPQSPYHGLLLFHGLGFGKTCSAITFAEEWLNQYTGLKDKEVWVITSSALIDNFKSQLFRKDSIKQESSRKQQCTSDSYYHLWRASSKQSMDEFERVMESRYKFYTYDRFGSMVQDYEEKGKLEQWAKNRVIIVDEAHNLRNPNIRGAIGLSKFVKHGFNNRLVLLTATPMFDQPDELLQLLHYLVENDKRTDIPSLENASLYVKGQLSKRMVPVLKTLCSNYISYVKGRNPFTLAVRLSPTLSGIPVLKKSPLYGYFDKDMETEQTSDWLNYIEDGLVPSEFEPSQARALDENLYMKKTAKNQVLRKEKLLDEGVKSIPINTNILEATNIVYPSKGQQPFQIGMEGFHGILKDTVYDIDEGGKKKASYVQYDYYGEPYLYPSENYLKQYSAKIYQIMQFIQNASGIVLIFSHYIWSGIIPMAVALEHLGYQRYQDRNFLKEPRKYDTSTQFQYKNPIPKTKTAGAYTIFCSDNAISGVDTFQGLLDIINGDGNQHGETIKVILMSPVASEGISFKNVRELHILDPWYHFNRLEQVIGRSIRTCSHKDLPLEERNVSVFLHTTLYPKSHKNHSTETYDTYVYHLSSDKKEKMQEIETYIRDYALDCSLQKNINYYDKALFPFQLKQLSSQGTQLYHTIGDPDNLQPKCHGLPKKVRDSAWRKDIYAPLSVIAKERLRKKFISGLKENHTKWETMSLLHSVEMPLEISLMALKEMKDSRDPIIYNGKSYQIQSHALAIWLIEISKSLQPIQLDIQSFIMESKDKGKEKGKDTEKEKERGKEKESTLTCDETVQSLLNYPYDTSHHHVTIVTFFTLLNLECWKDMAKQIIREQVQNTLTMALWKEGWLIRKGDISKDNGTEPSTSRDTPYAFIGYADIDLMQTSLDLKYQLWSLHKDGQWVERDISTQELRELQKKRKTFEPLTTMPLYGFYAMVVDKKNVKSLKFKIMMDTKSKREKTGIVSTSLTSIQLRELLDKLANMYQEMYKKEVPIKPNFEGKTGKENESNRTYLSSWVAYYMGMLNLLFIPPYVKPSSSEK
jgi:hypothetical protein